MSSPEPQVLFESMMAEKMHPSKAKGLGIINAICQQRFNAKATDWSVAGIGRESLERGGPSPDSLRQPRSEHYRALIDAWRNHAERTTPVQKVIPTSDEYAWIAGIENLATRQLVHHMRSKIQRLQDEVRLERKLRENGGVIELRNAHPSNRLPAQVAPVAGATIAMRRAVKKFVAGLLAKSSGELKDLGLSLTRGGDLVLEGTGEVLLEKDALDLLKLVASKD